MSILRVEVAAVLRVFNQDDTESREFAVSSFQLNWAVSEIPNAQLELALGKNVTVPGRREITNEAREFLGDFNKAQLITTIVGDWDFNTPWNSEPQVVFEGRLASVANGLARGKATLNVTLNHWLADLQSGTVLANYAHPANPNNPLNPAVSFGGTDGRNIGPSLIGGLMDANNLIAGEFENDIWGRGIKQLLANLLTDDDIVMNGVLENDCFDVVNSPVKPTDRARLALQRIEGPSDLLGSDYSDYAGPLSIVEALQEANDGLIIDSIAQTITHDPVQSYQTASPWAKLVRDILPKFNLAIVPRVDSAIVTPYLPCLRPTYCRKILAGDIVQCDSLEPIRKPYKASFIYANVPLKYGVSIKDAAGNSLVAAKESTGCFYPDLADAGSSILYSKPPAWLVKAASLGASSLVDLDNGLVRGGTAGPGETPDGKKDAVAATDIARAGLLDKYAAIRYYTERLRGRTINVYGRMRWDISPGSLVEVQARLDDIKGLGGDFISVIGFVERVTVSVDAQRKLAMTSFKLGSVRTETENDSDSFTIEEDPLYKGTEPFTGASLVEAYAYGDC